MFRDLESKSAYELAKTCGFHYLDHALERNVFPTEKAMQDLAKFEEKMPEWSTAKGMMEFTVTPRWPISFDSISTR